MDFSKLNSNEKLAVYGAVAAIVGALLSFGGGGTFTLLTGVAMLIIVFLPQFSPTTTLPGSKGSLMLIVGGIAGIAALLSLLAILTVLGAFALYGGLWFVGLLLSTAGGLLMGWASWKEFQSEGGKFNLGTASSAPPASTAPPAAPPVSSAPPAEPMARPIDEPMSPPAEPTSGSMDEPMRPMGGESNRDDEPPA
ncbi:MAG TPA: hypothetical protein VIN32_01590 [Candidatus Limnocylindria bacterium]|jgi:hypothetical protein